MSITIALAGNPNSGKTTLFNALTGANQFVGNWPGVTVEKKEGKLKGHKDVKVMDLPGIYSLSPYTLEEVVARNYLVNETPDAIINIIDGTNLERNLYLSTQLVELGIPVIMAVNMADVLAKRDIKLEYKALGEALGCEAVEISALKGKGINKLIDKAVALAKSKKPCKNISFDEDIEAAISNVTNKLDGSVDASKKRFVAIKALEQDEKLSDLVKEVPYVEGEVKVLEDKYDDDVESIITNARYEYITSVIGQCYIKRAEKKLSTSDRIDKVVTNRILALPIFAAMGAIKREMNNTKWFWFAIGYQCVFAYIIALIVFQIGSVITGSINILGFIVALILLAGLIYMLFRKNKYEGVEQ